MSITVVGSVALDTVETPFGRIERGLGGSAVHFSASASFFTDIKLSAVVGRDFPDEHINFLKSKNIDLEGLAIEKDGETFRWVGRYDYDLNNAQTLETHLNVFESFRPQLPESYKSPGILFLANIDPDLQRDVIQKAGKPKFIALDSMNLWIDIKKDSLIETIKMVDLVTINEGEARLLTNEPNLVKAARLVQKMGPKVVVIKRGEYGALMFFEEAIFCAPALPLEKIFDPTGAGDSFAGGMLGYLDKHGDITFENLKTAIICGSVMASFNVEEFSCERLKQITRDDIQARFKEFQDLGQFEGLRF